MGNVIFLLFQQSGKKNYKVIVRCKIQYFVIYDIDYDRIFLL